MSIDLSTLEVGDKVEVNGEELPVFKIIFCPKDDIVDYDLYKVFILVDSDKFYSNYCYCKDGSIFLGFHNITKIIKNPKQWTDDDLKQAFAEGAASASGRTKDYYLRMYNSSWTVFDNWLNKYRQKKVNP